MNSKDTGVIRHYFDWAASSYGNPSSLHSEGRQAKQTLENARERCACVLNVPPENLYFTSGGTESNSIALFSNLAKKSNGRVIASLAEHSSVREGLETLDKMGKFTGSIAVDSCGRVTSDLLSKSLEKYGDVRFVCCMAVNNETGAISDIPSLKEVLREKNGAPIHLHCDLVQATGKIPVDIPLWEIDSASISAHKLGGPRGIGLLYFRRKPEIFFTGGGQENGVRGGTENTEGAVLFADCLEKHARNDIVSNEYAKARKRWNKLIDAFNQMERAVIIPGEREKQEARDGFSPYIIQVAFRGIPGEVMARALDDLGFAVSTGSACASSSPERPVLVAMGVEEKLRIEGIRISQGYDTTDEEIDLLLQAISEVLKFL
uniref:Cysteine desulfurase n=1 Tax=uncultured bacterium contig00077 TaxID=1181555 RepID=A0A806KHV9_9BACT|nr:cysteine desulfurase [uncultured bacterium contig00077]